MNKKKQGSEEESNCGCYADSHTKKACPPVRNVTHPLRYYEFTQDELKALEECDRESFYRRCLPFSTLFAAATYYGVRNGHLRKGRHFGAALKVLAAAMAGHVVGRLSYSSQYQRRLQELPPSSRLAKIFSENSKPPTGKP